MSVSESVLVSESGNSIGSTKDKKRPNKRAINPTSKAAESKVINELASKGNSM